MAEVAKVGRFTLDEHGRVAGPRVYMEAPDGFAAVKADIEAGRSTVVMMGPAGTPFNTLVLVAIQTHFAGWLGARELLGGVR